MSTTIRPEVSKKKDYYISKHRMYELKHFCLQYPEWKTAYMNLGGYAATVMDGMPKGGNLIKPTEITVEHMLDWREKIDIVEECCKIVGEDLWSYLLKGVTEGVGYPVLNPPCCKETYYEMYRRFFWILNKKRK